MSRLYCPACRLRFFSRGDSSALGKCPRCEASIPGGGAVDANAWLASTVLADLRASRGSHLRGSPAFEAAPRAARTGGAVIESRETDLVRQPHPPGPAVRR